jgi:hypothetical protein
MFFENEDLKKVEFITERFIYYMVVLLGAFFIFAPLMWVPDNIQLENEFKNPVMWSMIGGIIIFQSRHITKDFKYDFTKIHSRIIDMVTLSAGLIVSSFALELLVEGSYVPIMLDGSAWFMLFSKLPVIGTFLIIYRAVASVFILEKERGYSEQ